MDDPGVRITRANARVEGARVRDQQRTGEGGVSAERPVDRVSCPLPHASRESRAREDNESRVLNDDECPGMRRLAANRDA
jgi:hypothetical protein